MAQFRATKARVKGLKTTCFCLCFASAYAKNILAVLAFVIYDRLGRQVRLKYRFSWYRYGSKAKNQRRSLDSNVYEMIGKSIKLPCRVTSDCLDCAAKSLALDALAISSCSMRSFRIQLGKASVQ